MGDANMKSAWLPTDREIRFRRKAWLVFNCLALPLWTVKEVTHLYNLAMQPAVTLGGAFDIVWPAVLGWSALDALVKIYRERATGH